MIRAVADLGGLSRRCRVQDTHQGLNLNCRRALLAQLTDAGHYVVRACWRASLGRLLSIPLRILTHDAAIRFHLIGCVPGPSDRLSSDGLVTLHSDLWPSPIDRLAGAAPRRHGGTDPAKEATRIGRCSAGLVYKPGFCRVSFVQRTPKSASKVGFARGRRREHRRSGGANATPFGGGKEHVVPDSRDSSRMGCRH
jgi:hypothetical protein